MRPEHNGLRHIFPSTSVIYRARRHLITPAFRWQHENSRMSKHIYVASSSRSRLICTRAPCANLPVLHTARVAPPGQRNLSGRYLHSASRLQSSDSLTLANPTQVIESEVDTDEVPPAFDPRKRPYTADELFEPNDSSENENIIGKSTTARNSPDPKPNIRSRWISVHPESHGISTKWTTGIAKLAARYDRASTASRRKRTIASQHKSILLEMNLPNAQADFRILRSWWISLDSVNRTQQWPQVMLWYLQCRPEHSLAFLLASFIRPLPAPYQIADVLDLAAKYAARECSVDECADVMYHLRRLISMALKSYGDALPLSQSTINRVARNTEASARYKFYLLLRHHGIQLHCNTLLHLSHDFAADAQFSEATLQTLTEAVRESNAQCPPEIPQAICSRLLRHAVRDRSFDTMSVIKHLDSLGITFSTRVYDVLIANASDQGRYDTAWSIFNLLVEPDLQPGCATFSTLFKMCRRTNDFQAFQQLFKEVRERESEEDGIQVDHVLACEMMYSSYCFTNGGEVDRMINVYRRYFDLQPLAALGILRETGTQAVAALQYALPTREEYRLGATFYGPRAPPTPRALALVLLAFLRRRDLRKELLERVYSNFKTLIATGDALICSVAEITMVWDSFLKAFGAHKDTLHIWPEIIKDMTEPLPTVARPGPISATSTSARCSDLFEQPEVAEELEFDTSTKAQQEGSASFFTSRAPIKAVKPTEQTWSILLHAFVAANYMQAAERVLKLMESHGLKPSAVKWNTIIRGYVRSGQTENVRDALANIKKEGLRWNRYTSRALQTKGSLGYPDRMGLGDRVRGGGMLTGNRLGGGTFEMAVEEADSKLNVPPEVDEQKEEWKS